MKTRFNQTDRKILDILMKDGRTSVSKISEIISLSNTGTQKRITKLNNLGFLKIRGNLNVNALNIKTCLIILEVKNHNSLATIIKNYKSCPYVYFLAETIGKCNLLIGFYGNSDIDLTVKLKYCGPANMEGILHSEIILISRLKYPMFMPLYFSNTRHKGGSCCFKCQNCLAYNKEKCIGCF